MSEVETVAEQSSPGQMLAAARDEHKLTLADVSQQIKYGVKQIAAIEADDYEKLPGTTFVRGMIRSYAKLLQLDPQPLLAELSRRNIPVAVPVDLHTSEREPFLEDGKKSNRIYALLSLAAMLAVAVVAYEWYVSPPATGEVVTITPTAPKTEVAQAPPAQASAAEQPGEAVQPADVVKSDEADTLSADPQSLATPLPVTSAGVMPGEPKRIELEFDQVSWVRIKQGNGKVLLSQLNPAGSKQSVDGAPPFELVIGNADHVRLKYNDTPVDLRPYFKVDVARLTLE